MSLAYKHGVYIQELPTKLFALNFTDSAIPFIVGNAPKGPINELKLVTSYTEAVSLFGSDDEYTIPRALRVLMTLYGVAPVFVVCVSNEREVSDNEIIGGVNEETGSREGLELVEECFSKYGLLPGILLAPSHSSSAVANALIGKAGAINGLFKAMTYFDVEGEDIEDAVNAKRNYNSPFAVVCYPKVSCEGKGDDLSLHAAALTAQIDFRNSNIPYESPSNKALLIEGPTKLLTLLESNYLNSQGLTTVVRVITGWKLWGNHTSAYPETTDIKDMFIPCRRMANWIENTLILTTYQKVDNPINRRLIETIVDSVNIWLNGLVGRGFLLGARVAFLPEENPLTDLAAGIIRFHIWYLSPPPAQAIEYVLEVDVNYFNTLFETV